jgi:OOP family OmpA-OmpF porin
VKYVFADSDRKADDDWGAGLSLGKPLNPSWNLEAELSGDWLDGEGGGPGDYDHIGLGVNALYFFNRSTAFSPYVLMGAGGLNTDVGDDDDWGFMANAGVGFLSRITDNLSFRADARYRWDDNAPDAREEDDFGDIIVTAGVSLALGPKAAPPPPPVKEPPKPIDSDGDGVTDDKDRCPGTPAGAKVDAKGCELDSDGDGVVDRLDQCPGTPAGAKVDAKGCELDSDGDGVVDRLDQCPGTPAGAKVDAKGCELDSDGDGVVDSLDKCPDTPPGTKVDSQGCPLPEVIVLKGVSFDYDSAVLRPDGLAALDDAAATLKRYPEIRVEIAGHTDSIASEEYNQDLSERRARSVMDYLVEHGIAAERLSAKGYGESQPVADNATEEGRASNRRVELHILK